MNDEFKTLKKFDAGSENKNPSRPLPASNFFRVLNSSFIFDGHPERTRRISHRIVGSPDLVCVIRSSTVRFVALLGMTNSFQLRKFGFDLVEIGQLLRVVVALGVLDHATSIDDERGTLWHTAHSEIDLRQKRIVNDSVIFRDLMLVIAE